MSVATQRVRCGAVRHAMRTTNAGAQARSHVSSAQMDSPTLQVTHCAAILTACSTCPGTQQAAAFPGLVECYSCPSRTARAAGTAGYAPSRVRCDAQD
eukprot:772409-Rhodomonas_salina.3